MYPLFFHFGPLLVPTYGLLAALGILFALGLLRREAARSGLDPERLWRVAVAALFAALAAMRLLVVLANWPALCRHPGWFGALAIVRHPLLSAVGLLVALAIALLYGRGLGLALCPSADVLAAPVALALGFEQLGALAAGSGYGRASTLPWAITYTHPLAAIWSGAPLGEPLHPVQAYAAFFLFLLAAALLFAPSLRRRAGDRAGVLLFALALILFFTEFCRDPEGRGLFFAGALDGPQLASLPLLAAGLLFLWERPTSPQQPTKKEIAHERRA